MEKIINYNNFIFFLFLYFSFFYYIKTLQNFGSKFPVSLTLHNDNILLITANNITFYDPSLSSIITSYNLSESEIALYSQESDKTMACQYPQEYNSYILVLVKDQLYFFDKNGNKITKKNYTSQFKDQAYYEIIPIKKMENNLYYIISLTTKTTSPYMIKLFYYLINIDTHENSLIIEKDYTPKTIYNNNFDSISDNVACLLMNSNEQNNALTCFYSGTFPCQISITSFSLENDNITELPSFSESIPYTNYSYINLFKAKPSLDKSKAYIVFSIYELGGFSAIYDININKLYNIEERVGKYCVGSGIRCLNFFYFEKTEEFVLFFRDNDRTFRIIIMDKDYNVINNENGDISFKFVNNENNVLKETIIFFNNHFYQMQNFIIVKGFKHIHLI